MQTISASRAHDGIVDYGLGDWFDIGPGDAGFSKLTTAGVTGTAIYYQDLKAAGKDCRGAGQERGQRGLRAAGGDACAIFSTRGSSMPRKHRYDKGSQTAQAMPLALGMVPEDQRAAVLDALVADIRAHQNHTTCGEVGFHYEVEALLDGGRSDVLLDMLERTDAPSYGYILAQGATSLTEALGRRPLAGPLHAGQRGGVVLSRAGRDQRGSFARGRTAAGSAPGRWRETSRGCAPLRSVVGEIESEWHRGATETVYNFTIPANATATIEIDSAAAGMVTVNGVRRAKLRES